MKLGFSLKPGWCSSDDTESFLDFLSDAGVNSVELTLPSSGNFDHKTAEAALTRNMTVTFHIIWDSKASWDWYRGWNTETGRNGFDRLLNTLDVWAKRQKNPALVVIHPCDNGRNRQQGITTTVDFCRWLVERTTMKKHKVQWVIENMPHDPNVPSRPGDRVEEIDNMIKSMPGLGICWDIGHWHLTRSINPTWSSPLTNHFIAHTAHTHIHDYTSKLGDHLPPGHGTVPLTTALHRLHTAGYNGWLTLELDYNKALHFSKPRDVARDALTFVHKTWTSTMKTEIGHR
ncbi:MAG: sugar phosphate isomerase/epimerase [Spirochaetales bacterium]|jgi:sugar phosphate isomerase/epimerase|nr:sugar phosphate isomerase/epimerase [Spirochaetales bacterium]